LRKTILDRLADGWSPERICGCLAREAGRRIINRKSIYRFVCAQLKRTKDRRLRHYLARGNTSAAGAPRQDAP
jgi:IS30 family transposase